MAITRSAKKAMRVSARKTAVNILIKKSYREAKKQVIKALNSGNVEEAEKLMPKYQSELDKAVKKKTIKRNTAARYKSRAVKMIQKGKK